MAAVAIFLSPQFEAGEGGPVSNRTLAYIAMALSAGGAITAILAERIRQRRAQTGRSPLPA